MSSISVKKYIAALWGLAHAFDRKTLVLSFLKPALCILFFIVLILLLEGIAIGATVAAFCLFLNSQGLNFPLALLLTAVLCVIFVYASYFLGVRYFLRKKEKKLREGINFLGPIGLSGFVDGLFNSFLDGLFSKESTDEEVTRSKRG